MKQRMMVIGHTGGIGKALIAKSRQEGWWVMGASRGSAPDADPIDSELSVDITLPQDRRRLITAIVENEINVVVFAAGTPHFSPTASVSDSEIDRVLNCNLLAPMAITSGLLADTANLFSVKTLLYVGSTVGDIGLPGYSVYGASKSGLHRYVESLRREMAGGQIAFKLIIPRATETKFNSALAAAYGSATGASVDTPEFVAQAIFGVITGKQATKSVGSLESIFAKINQLFGAWIDFAFKKHALALKDLKQQR